MEMMTYISARANAFAYRPYTPIDLPAGWPYRASARSMDLLVSFHSQCRGMKFYELRSTGAEWDTKLKLVKESTTPHDHGHCVSQLGSLGYPVREARMELDL